MNGAMTLNLVRQHLKRFVSFPTDEAADLCTLWAVHSHCRDTAGRLALATSPRLMFLSKLPASGKTAAMERVISVCHNPRTVIDPTPLSLATLIDEGRPTIAFDEIDCAFGNGQAKQQVRSILNSGYKPGAEFSRGRGDPINIFAPIVMAGLSKRVLVDATLAALRSRAFIVEMEPGIPSEEYWEADHGALTANYRAMLALWCKRNLGAILAARPVAPAGIEGRQKEIIYPLLQIAEVSGGHWPETAAAAARLLLLGVVPEDAPDELNLMEQLLTDLRTVYADADRMATTDIVAGLYATPGAPWSRVWPTRPKAPRELAQLLGAMGTDPVVMRIDGNNVRGYHREGLENLWDEMLSDADVALDVADDEALDVDDDELIDA